MAVDVENHAPLRRRVSDARHVGTSNVFDRTKHPGRSSRSNFSRSLRIAAGCKNTTTTSTSLKSASKTFRRCNAKFPLRTNTPFNREYNHGIGDNSYPTTSEPGNRADIGYAKEPHPDPKSTIFPSVDSGINPTIARTALGELGIGVIPSRIP